MIKTFVQDRGTGKTTTVIELMEEDVKAILITPISSMKRLYPKEIHDRIMTWENVLTGDLLGRRFTKVVLDEGFLASKDRLAHMYYYLGYHQIETVIYGTLPF